MMLPKVTVNAEECTHVRLLEILKDAILYAHKWAVDRSIIETYVKDMTEGLQAFVCDLKSQGVAINVEVYADETQNTASALGAGKSYWNIRLTDSLHDDPSLYCMEVTSVWTPVVLSINEAAQ